MVGTQWGRGGDAVVQEEGKALVGVSENTPFPPPVRGVLLDVSVPKASQGGSPIA